MKSFNFVTKLACLCGIKKYRYLQKPHSAGLEREKTTLGYIEIGVAATWYSLFFLKFSIL